MTRDKQKDEAYFSKWIQFIVGSLKRRAEEMPSLPYIPGRLGAAQSLTSDALQLVIYQYSRGDSFDEIRPNVWRWIELKELQARVYATTPAEFHKVRAMYERVTLDTVYDALTMMAFSKALHFSGDERKRLLKAIGHSGEDALIDIAAVKMGDNVRQASSTSKFPKVYGPLLEIWGSDPERRADAVVAYGKSWKKKMRPIYWSDNLNGGEGAYFGYWAFELALSVILFNIDDKALRANPYYPADVVDASV
ncbi:hypothetical protein RU07_22135 [Agrobacterium tumefaciens]|uniref:PoNi C-terminal domain-containing protein n=1 Tax=Agrobacterium tumefaciens TaxID=358 RepID=A0A0D0IYR3_AGRTU|nr:hypothetical protein RU07_22135 [Agrobacterium tumefaciens]